MAKKKQPKGETVTKVLGFKLTDEEKAQKGMEAAKLHQEVNELVVKKKIETDKFSAQIKTKSAKVATLLQSIDSGIEHRETECTKVMNFEASRVEYWVDGEVIESREMTEADRQLELGGAAAKTKKAGKGKGFQKPTTEAAYESSDRKADADKETAKAREIRQVHREETGRNSSYSMVNGARA